MTDVVTKFQEALDDFIRLSDGRYRTTRDTVFKYRLSLDDLGVQRVTQQLKDKIFREAALNNLVDITLYDSRKEFVIVLDIWTVVRSPKSLYRA